MFHVVIPARYGSSRLPGKPLLNIMGKPMIQHVYARALESGFKSICVATDSKDIFDVVKGFGGEVVMTDENHATGSDRLAEVASILKYDDEDVVINLQGDEPFVPPECISSLAEAFNRNTDVDIATLCCELKSVDDIFNPNVVKVVKALNNKALYFSRAPIPWDRNNFSHQQQIDALSGKYEKHIGMYAYRVEKLLELTRLPQSPLEVLESLEQLRALEAGMTIVVESLDASPPHGIDTHEDYTRLLKELESNR